MKLLPPTETILHLMTPDGGVSVPITVRFIGSESPVTSNNVTSMSLHLVYDNCEYVGIGTKYPYMDAFANLQKQLPNGILLKACVNCVHGNLCPYGDLPNLLFCTKQFAITEKMDLVRLIANNSLTNQNDRTFTDICEDFQMQTSDTYSYSDYLYYLSE